MDELKPIFFINEDEIIKEVTAPYSELGVHFFCCHHNLDYIETLEFEGFIAVLVEDK